MIGPLGADGLKKFSCDLESLIGRLIKNGFVERRENALVGVARKDLSKKNESQVYGYYASVIRGYKNFFARCENTNDLFYAFSLLSDSFRATIGKSSIPIERVLGLRNKVPMEVIWSLNMDYMKPEKSLWSSAWEKGFVDPKEWYIMLVREFYLYNFRSLLYANRGVPRTYM